jgi:hypothetical protein
MRRKTVILANNRVYAKDFNVEKIALALALALIKTEWLKISDLRKARS